MKMLNWCNILHSLNGKLGDRALLHLCHFCSFSPQKLMFTLVLLEVLQMGLSSHFCSLVLAESKLTALEL